MRNVLLRLVGRAIPMVTVLLMARPIAFKTTASWPLSCMGENAC